MATKRNVGAYFFRLISYTDAHGEKANQSSELSSESAYLYTD